ncbi:galactonate dehydratase [Bifidobacterium sp. ESL0732]|uniref:galactonate dehydratase n=1 Tax=Bifidobacterium sp. ESL0732 TaxID=2983222 RepID=UPI0023F7BA08|nr:galactonate dehydratase [Bifidobacterium sp. ESL0732]WEV63913.1 galactonate dehydratase [Bifidobacterium sp. ESL0732]
MKITDIKTYLVPHRYAFVCIETDSGITGWGEPLVEGRAKTTLQAVQEWRGYLIGKDPRDIERHWEVMYRGSFYRGGPVLMSAIAGIDQALWDITAKSLGVSVHAMLGGSVKEKVKVYRSIHGDTPEELADDAQRAVQEGYQLIKSSALGPMHFLDSVERIDEVVERIGAVRDRIGYKVGIAVDFHGRVHRPMARQLAKALNQFRLAFIEEPVLPTNREALHQIADVSDAPIALGERLYSRWDFKDILEDGAVDILQPDLSHAGGISECHRIAAMAEAYDTAFAPHCPLGPIAFASCIQTDAASETAVFQEQSINIHDTSSANPIFDVLRNRDVFHYENGFVQLPDAPGLGIDIDQEKVEELAKIGHDWKNPLWVTYDGTPIEW